MKEICLLLFFASIALSARIQTQDGSSIDGTAIHSRSGQPLAAARVLLKTRHSDQIAVTDQTGRFTFENVPNGEVQIGFDGVPTGTFERNPRMGSPIVLTVEPNQHIQNVKLSAVTGGVITGKITLSDGTPATKTVVEVAGMTYDLLGYCTFGNVATSETDDRGEYRLFGLQPGDYYVRAQNLETQGVGIRSRTFFPGTMDPSRTQSIVVRDEEEVDHIDFGVAKTVATLISGRLIFEKAPTTDYVVRIEAQKMDGACRQGPQSGFRATGANFIGNVAAIEGNFELVASVVPQANSSTDPIMNQMLTMVNALARLPNRLYTGRTQVQVHGTPLDGVAIQLRSLPQLSGQVSIAEGSGDIPFNVLRATIAYPRGAYPLRSLDSNGKFALPLENDDRQYISIQSIPGNGFIKDILIKGKSMFDQGINLRDANLDSIDVIIDSRGGRIEGVVRDSTGMLVPYAKVVLVPTDRRPNPLLYQVTSTDQDGVFRFRGVMPENYKIFAWLTVPDNAWHNGEFLAPYEQMATAVQVDPSSSLMKVDVLISSTGLSHGAQ